MEETNDCPCCGNHCPMNALACGKGRRYFESGTSETAERYEHKDGSVHDGERHHEGKEKHKGDKHHHGRHHRDEPMDTDAKLRMMMRRCGHVLYHQTGGKAGQERVLRLLSKQELTSQKELLETMEIKAGSLSELLGKMEQSNLIIRKSNETDKRGVDVCLSEEGKVAAATLQNEHQQQTKQMFECLDELEKEALLVTLEKLLHSWKDQFPGTHHHKHKEKQHIATEEDK